MKQETIICDECGKQKGDVNHWFVICVASGSKRMVNGIHVMAWGTDRSYELQPATESELHMCGQACVIQAVQKWMDAQSKQATQVIADKLSEWQMRYDCVTGTGLAGVLGLVPGPQSPPEYRHKPQCAMTCSDGAEKCDCEALAI